VAERYPEELKIFGLSVHRNTEALSAQIEKHHPRIVCIADSAAAGKFMPTARKMGVELLAGDEGLEQLASHSDSDIILNSVVGFVGLRSTLAAARAGKRIALANKESMVAGGELVDRTLRQNKGEIIPVDSEHSAIFQCLKSGRFEDIRRLILTSSGGPFRNTSHSDFPSITVEQALNHPTWNMGRKITIDSATLMNKGLEIIEAAYLFGLPHEKIKVAIHPQSIVHSMVEYRDGSIIAQMSRPDMRLPILYAFFYPERREMEIADLSFEAPLTLDFAEPDTLKFPSLNLARMALDYGRSAPAVFNAANEAAVEAFLARRIKFVDIFGIVEYALGKAHLVDTANIESIISADKEGRELAGEYLRNRSV